MSTCADEEEEGCNIFIKGAFAVSGGDDGAEYDKKGGGGCAWLRCPTDYWHI